MVVVVISEVIRAFSSKHLGGPWELEPLLQFRGEYKAVGIGRKQASLAQRANKIVVMYQCRLQLGCGEY